MQSDLIVIKRYLNRKLYNATTSRYITLPEIKNIIVSGKQVVVLDNATKGDITAKVLADIYAQQKFSEVIDRPDAIAFITEALKTNAKRN